MKKLTTKIKVHGLEVELSDRQIAHALRDILNDIRFFQPKGFPQKRALLSKRVHPWSNKIMDYICICGAKFPVVPVNKVKKKTRRYSWVRTSGKGFEWRYKSRPATYWSRPDTTRLKGYIDAIKHAKKHQSQPRKTRELFDQKKAMDVLTRKGRSR